MNDQTRKTMCTRLGMGILNICILIAGLSFAYTPEKDKTQKAINSLSTFNKEYALLNINNLTSWLRADGQMNHGPSNSVGTHFPRGTAVVIYQDGFVWGGKAYIDSDMQQPAPFDQLIRVGGGSYQTGTRAGRIIGSGATAFAANPDSEESRIYRIRRDYLTMSKDEVIKDAAETNEINPKEVTSSQLQEIQAQYARDWREWPVQFGAPFIDRNGNNIYDPPPEFDDNFTAADLITDNYDEPGISAGTPNFPADQVIYTIFNDLNQDKTRKFSDSEPLGLELQLTQWAFKSKDNWNGIYYRKLKIINKGGVEISENDTKGSFWLDSMYICLWTDGDLGNHSDDLVGTDLALNLGYYYNEISLDNEFRKFNLPPPSIGYLYLQGPRIPAQGESAFFNGKTIADWKNLPMSSFTFFGTGNPFSDPGGSYQTNTIQWYKILRGFAPLFGPDVRYSFPPGVEPTFFPYAGNPVTATGHIDGLGKEYSLRGGDRRTMISSGPFTLAPGDTQEVVLAFAAGLGADRLSSITVMKHVARQLQLWYPYHPKFETVDIDEPVVLDAPIYYELSQNYPNPFFGQTQIQYTIPLPSQIQLTIYDILGREIRVLESGQKQVGTYQTNWDGRDQNGKQTPSGIYIYRLQIDHVELTRKLFRLR